MRAIAWWEYLGVFAVGLVLVFSLTPGARWIAQRFDVLDHPGGYKRQSTPVPYLGGLAIVVGFSVAVLGAAWLLAPASELDELAFVLGLGVILGGIGLLDDIRGLSAWSRFAVQASAGLAAVAAGLQVEMFEIGILNALITVLWIVGVTNAFNLLDNMDGLSAGVATIAAGFFFLIAAVNGQFLVAALSAALAGCGLGFLWHNFHPARIYMGDAGSLFFGAVLSILGLKLEFAGPTEVTFFVPILVVSVALLDTFLVVFDRLRTGKNPLSGGRDHTSHRLVAIGLPVQAAVGVIYSAALGGGWAALIMSRVDRTTGFLLMSGTLAAGLFFSYLLLRVPVYDQVEFTSDSAESASTLEGVS